MMRRDVFCDCHTRLLRCHCDLLQEHYGLPCDIIAERGYESVLEETVLEELGFSKSHRRVPGILIPLHRTDGSRHGVVYRPDVPAERNGRKAKYVSPRGSGRQLDVPPRCQPRIGDPSVPLFIVEGHQKVDAVAARGGCAAAIDGVYGWRGKNAVGGITALPDWEDIALKGRTIYLGFDSDARSNEQVAQALRRLDRWLSSKNAVVKALIPPPAEDGTKIGADDFLKDHSLEEYVALAENVEQAEFDSNESGPSQADLLVAVSSEAELFRTPSADTFARVPVGDHREIWPVRSSAFKHWLARRFWERGAKAPGSDALAAALNVIGGNARFGSEEHDLHNRVAWHNGATYYDLADERWRAVRITPDGWEVVFEPPSLFRRYAHQRPQVEPVQGGNVQELLRFLNVSSDEDGLLVLVATVACFVPDIAHPLVYPHGDHGAGKTYLHRVIRRVVDPSHTEVLSFPRDAKEFAQKLAHNYFAPFDNVSRLGDEQADILCRAVTGEGFVKRMLYTDDDDVIYSFRRCVGLNGINVVSQRPDLLDRTLLVELERIPPNQRREEADFWRDFEGSRPSILGGVFDALSHALRLYPDIHLAEMPRLADFARWGEAIARALGYPEGAFLSAYLRNIEGQNRQVLEGSTVATAVLALMDGRDEWHSTMGELLGELQVLAERLRIDIHSRAWPKAPNALGRELRAVRTTLRDAGVEVTIGKHTKKGTLVTLKVRESIVTTVTSSPAYLRQPVQGDDVAPAGGDIVTQGVGVVTSKAASRIRGDDGDDGDDGSGTSESDQWEVEVT
jgi:hypothetical protein